MNDPPESFQKHHTNHTWYIHLFYGYQIILLLLLNTKGTYRTMGNTFSESNFLFFYQTLALLAGFQGVLQRNPVASSDEEKETEDVKDDDTGW